MTRTRSAPTISQVAAAAGVSRSSVSRAFTNPHLLSEETVKNVLRIADEIGYVPNHTARALSTGRYANIAIIVPDIANPFFPPMIKAAQEDADNSGFCVFLGNSDEDPAREDQLLARFLGQVEGFILVSSRLSEQRIRHYVERCPLVLINRDIKGLPRVLIDSGPGVSEAVHHLAELGHKSIAYLSGPKRSWSNTQRLAAVKKAGRELDLKVSVISTTTPSYQAAREASARLINTGATAVISFDDLTAQGVIAGLSDHGLVVPRDISVVGCDDVLDAATHPTLTSVSSRSAESGRTALSILLDFLRKGNTGDIRFSLDTRLVSRETTASPRQP